MPSYRGYRPRLLWGTQTSSTYANAWDFGYPLDAPVAASRDREGSEEVQLVSGVEDASQAGQDYYLSGVVRWVPGEDTLASGTVRRATGWDGTSGVDAALHWLRGKRAAVWCPDSRNLLRSPSLNIAHPSVRWPLSLSGTVSGSVANDASATKVTFSTGTTNAANAAAIAQVVPGLLAGETVSLAVTYQTASFVGSPTLRIAIEFYTAVGGSYVSEVNAAPSTSATFTRTSVLTGTVPSGATAARVALYAVYPTAGQSGEVWWKEASLARTTADATTYCDNPEVASVTLVAPWNEDPTPERNGTRTFPLSLRSTSAFTGY